MEKDSPSKWKLKAEEGTLISYKIDFKPKMVAIDKKGHCIMSNESIHQEDKS